jgi:hypothetical protein
LISGGCVSLCALFILLEGASGMVGGEVRMNFEEGLSKREGLCTVIHLLKMTWLEQEEGDYKCLV